MEVAKAHLGSLNTRVLEDKQSKEGGIFTMEVGFDDKLAMATGSPEEYCKTLIAAHLASACKDTETEPYMWEFAVNEIWAKRFNWPALMEFGK